MLPYVGLVLGGLKGEWLEPGRIAGVFRASGIQRRYKILDTSVIIDGRIADVCKTGFIDGRSSFRSSSSRSSRRSLTRRLAQAEPRPAWPRILQRIQKESGVEVMISDADFPELRESRLETD